MTANARLTRLRAHIDDDAPGGAQRLADLIVQRARDHGLADAIVLRGRSDFERGSEPSDRPPADVEIVDVSDRLFGFVRELAGLEGIGLVPLERVEEPKASDRGQTMSTTKRGSAA